MKNGHLTTRIEHQNNLSKATVKKRRWDLASSIQTNETRTDVRTHAIVFVFSEFSREIHFCTTEKIVTQKWSSLPQLGNDTCGKK